MRTLSALFTGMVFLGISALPGIHAGDKEEKDNRKKLEQTLVETERALELEKKEWAVKNKQYIAELRQHLEAAERIELFRLDPSPLSEEQQRAKQNFHGYAIAFEMNVENEQRKKVASFLANSLHWNHGRRAVCFSPRHGLRASSAKKTLDFLICFECYRIEIFEGKNEQGSLAIGFVDDNIIAKMVRR